MSSDRRCRAEPWPDNERGASVAWVSSCASEVLRSAQSAAQGTVQGAGPASSCTGSSREVVADEVRLAGCKNSKFRSSMTFNHHCVDRLLVKQRCAESDTHVSFAWQAQSCRHSGMQQEVGVMRGMRHHMDNAKASTPV